MNTLTKYFKALQTLGLSKLWDYAVYQIGLRTGYFKRVTPCQHEEFSGTPSLEPYPKFPKVSKTQKYLALAQADDIRNGVVRLFGGDPVPLDLTNGTSSEHWSSLVSLPPEQDIKFLWEPARLGWAITLARAYAFSGDDGYAIDFWDKTLLFLNTHPPNQGYQWQSAQEVAIRLMALVFCDRVFAHAPSSKPEYRTRLWGAIIEHAQRIPPTMMYARAQNNNHLISEAAGLLTAGLYLPDHPQAAKWRLTGWEWLNWGFQHQIEKFGTYIQHSVNYHRLMLQIALFIDHLLCITADLSWPAATLAHLRAATQWLWTLTDPQSGRVPNLGANDGAYLFPLTQLTFEDYRPVVDAAAKAFLNYDVYRQPELSEMADWFELSAPTLQVEKRLYAPDMSQISGKHSRAFMHTAQFKDRPSHADQLHVDLWWRGVNVALDPGTYRYSASPPWENALTSTKVHNTLTINDRDQMLRAGRFLWLDLAQAQIISHKTDASGDLIQITAEHNGYRKLGVRHMRSLARANEGWTIKDFVVPRGGRPPEKHVDLHLTWLLPDWKWDLLNENLIRFTGEIFSFQLQIEGAEKINLFRAGKRLHGSLRADPTWGWYAPSYGNKQPALMVVATKKTLLPTELISLWQFNT